MDIPSRTYAEQKRFMFPIAPNRADEAIAFIEEYGVAALVQNSNLCDYAPNVFPLSDSQISHMWKMKKTSERVYELLVLYIDHSRHTWANSSTSAPDNWMLDEECSSYIHRYGMKFLMNEGIDEMPPDAFVFPLLPAEMVFAKDVLEEHGTAAFVKHCKELPACWFVHDNIDETSRHMEELRRQCGSYWLVGQLQSASVLAIKSA